MVHPPPPPKKNPGSILGIPMGLGGGGGGGRGSQRPTLLMESMKLHCNLQRVEGLHNPLMTLIMRGGVG